MGFGQKDVRSKGNSFEASTNSSAEEHAPEKAAEEVEKVGSISSEKSREAAVGKGALL